MDIKEWKRQKYLEFLKKKEKENKERYLKEFEKYPNGGIFRKLKIDIFSDYEFVSDNGVLKHYYYSNSNRNAINSKSLYIRKINNNLCREVLTGIRFERTEDNNFYSEDTGLRFNFDNSFEIAVGMELDWVYIDNTREFLEHYRELQREDTELRSKAEAIFLKRGINFRK